MEKRSDPENAWAEIVEALCERFDCGPAALLDVVSIRLHPRVLPESDMVIGRPCMYCKQPVGNTVFTCCDECWPKYPIGTLPDEVPRGPATKSRDQSIPAPGYCVEQWENGWQTFECACRDEPPVHLTKQAALDWSWEKFDERQALARPLADPPPLSVIRRRLVHLVGDESEVGEHMASDAFQATERTEYEKAKLWIFEVLKALEATPEGQR